MAMAGFQALKILLVEDNQHMRTIIREVLKGAGMPAIQEAHDGADAFELLRQFPADIAIVDFNMAPVDGIDFTRMLRKAPDSLNPMMPVIMITGHSERSRVEEARDAGVNEFIVKPLTAKALLARIHSVVMTPRPYVRSKTFIGPETPPPPRRIQGPGPARRLIPARLPLPVAQLRPIVQPLADLALVAVTFGIVEFRPRHAVGEVVLPGKAVRVVGIVDIAFAIADVLHQPGRRVADDERRIEMAGLAGPASAPP